MKYLMLSIRIGLCFLKQLPYPYSRVWKKRECAWAVADLMRNAREAETKVYGWGLDVDVDEDGMEWVWDLAVPFLRSAAWWTSPGRRSWLSRFEMGQELVIPLRLSAAITGAIQFSAPLQEWKNLTEMQYDECRENTFQFQRCTENSDHTFLKSIRYF